MGLPIRVDIETSHGPRSILVDAAAQSLRLNDLLRREQLPLNTRCGGRGACEGCMVELRAGSLIQISDGTIVQAQNDNAEPLLVRACDHRLNGTSPVRLGIPIRSTLAYEAHVLSDYRINVPYAHDPVWQQVQVSADPSALIQAVKTQLQTTRPVVLAPGLTAHGDPQFATVECQPCIQPENTSLDTHQYIISSLSNHRLTTPLGVAIDIGTTTVALLLVDLVTGKIVGRASSFNLQMNLGDDVVTRITLCLNDKTMLSELQAALTQRTLRPLLTQALAQANAHADQIVCMTAAGNTTMLHLLAGVDPSRMGSVPFTPEFVHHHTRPADALFSTRDSAQPATRPGTQVHLLPGASAYIGADIAAGVLASGLYYEEGPSLLVDVGTNGEIVLKARGKMLGCATAAGPAFEGAGLSSGIRAGDGAISRIFMDRSPFGVRTERIGSGKTALGLCGSAYVDFLAEARRVGLLNSSGRFDLDALPAARPFIHPDPHNVLAFHLADSLGNNPIVVSETDVARLLSAKGAVAAGIVVLLRRAGLQASDIKHVYLAGGFGTHMSQASAIACGLLPGFTPEQIVPVGNTSLAGAYLSLVDEGIISELTRIARNIETIELNTDPTFEGEYIDQLSLPDPL